MKIYFAADNQAGPNLQQRYAEIITMLTKAGVLVMSNLINEQLSTFSQSDRRAIEHSGEIMLDRVDALIMEGTSQIPESGYMIALAMAHHKPVLYLWEEGKPINQSLRHLHSGKEAAKLLDLQNYEPKNISTIVFNFLKKVQKGEA